ncbi:MAG: T9SS type A sorting domain-containing protein [Fidelibacterota bacterium]
MRAQQIVIIILLTILLVGMGLAMDCPPDTSYHIDLRTMLPDGTPNPNYGQLIPTGLCACLDFVTAVTVHPEDSTVTLTLRMVDNEPVRGMEVDVYHDAGTALAFSGAGTVEKGEKLLNVTDPDGNPKTMTLLANEIGDFVKVMAYSTSQAQTAGDGTEGDLFMITYKAPNGLTSLPATVGFSLGLVNLPGTSMAPDLLNVACSYPDTTNPTVVDVTLDVSEKPGIPVSYALAQNYPNPFNPSTSITFDIPRNTKVTLAVYNLIGQHVVTLVNDVFQPGRFEVEWNGLDAAKNPVASGVYFYELRTEQYTNRKKMILLR